MKKLNKINWNKIRLYHGTNDTYLSSIQDKGFFIPQHDGNWLGRGTYFAVNNIFLPILFSNMHVNKNGGAPAIIEIDANYLAEDIKANVLDLTSQDGLNTFHNICNDFVNFIKPYEGYPELKKELGLLEKHYAASPLYSDKCKPNLIPNLEWFLLAIGLKPIANILDIESDERIYSLYQKGEENITNLIFDWFNFKFSSGMEKDVPIRGIMANFNSGEGTPIALSKVLKGDQIKRGFADYISYLNRTELTIFGYDYYKADNKFWSFDSLFKESPRKNKHFKTYVGKGPIEKLLEKSFGEAKAFGYKMDQKAISDLYNFLIEEHDTN